MDMHHAGRIQKGGGIWNAPVSERPDSVLRELVKEEVRLRMKRSRVFLVVIVTLRRLGIVSHFPRGRGPEFSVFVFFGFLFG